MKKSFSFWQFSVLVLVCTAVLSTGIFLYVNRLSSILHADLKIYLSEVAKQGVNTVQAKVQDDLDLLTSISTAIGSLSNPTEGTIIRLMKAESESNNFKRMGFVYPNGMAVLSDDLLLDISKEEHFQKAISGTPNVSNLIKDASDGKNIFVESVPVYHKGKIIGALFATRGTEEFTQALNIASFGGEGYSVVVRSNGDKIVGALHKNAVSGMYNIFNSPDDPDHELAQNIQGELAQGKSGTIHYHSAEKGDLHISYEPLAVNDWYLFSVVPTAHLNAQINAFITLLLILCLAIAVAGLAVWGYVYIQQRKSREQLFHAAFTDPITGFPNADANRPQVEDLLKNNPDTPYAVVAMDVSKFKIFNEQHGYDTGNILLNHIAKVIHANLQQDEIFTRIYGDYFAMLLKYDSPGALKNRLELLSEQITSFETENCQAYPLLLAFGVYPVQDRSMSIRAMYNRATVAKSQVKGRYDEIVAFYHPDWQQKLENEDFVERHMQKALQNDELRFFLQPIISLETGKIGAAMAQAEWQVAKQNRTLTMEEFLPVFRKNGFIYQFDRFLFESACKTLAQWKKDGTPLIPIVVNFSNELLYEADCTRKLAHKAAQYDVETKWLILELTETSHTDFQPQLKRSGEELRKAGFGLTVRYEGKGVTLSNIFQHLPVEGIKAAPSIWAPGADEKQTAIAKALTDICKQLNIFLAADGVSSPEDLERIKQLGFQYAQGPAAAPAESPQALAQRLSQQQN